MTLMVPLINNKSSQWSIFIKSAADLEKRPWSLGSLFGNEANPRFFPYDNQRKP